MLAHERGPCVLSEHDPQSGPSTAGSSTPQPRDLHDRLRIVRRVAEAQGHAHGEVGFADKASWRLRGKLDVSKERFIGYPGLGRDADPTPLVGWVGWDHLDSAQPWPRSTSSAGQPTAGAPTASRRSSPSRPSRSHGSATGQDVDPATGLRLGDFSAGFVATESATDGLRPTI